MEEGHTSYTQQRPVGELRLNGLLDLSIRYEVHRRPIGQHEHRTMQRNSNTYVASSMITTRLSFTSARAKLSNDRCPTLRFAPLGSMNVSSVMRFSL